MIKYYIGLVRKPSIFIIRQALKACRNASESGQTWTAAYSRVPVMARFPHVSTCLPGGRISFCSNQMLYRIIRGQIDRQTDRFVCLFRFNIGQGGTSHQLGHSLHQNNQTDGRRCDVLQSAQNCAAAYRTGPILPAVLVRFQHVAA